MKTFFISGILALSIPLAHAQFGGPGGGMGGMGRALGPQLGGHMKKIFGEHKNFSADLEFKINDKSGDTTTLPGAIAYSDGQACFEMDLTQMKNPKMPEGAGEQMKMMGMDKMTAISRPDKKLSYLVYPGLNAHVETPQKEVEGAKEDSDFTIEVSEIGNEKVEGHECSKNKVVVTDKNGKKHESTVWNAKDMNKFPVKIETNDNGNNVVMTFKGVKLSKPDSKRFDPPSGSTKYDDMMSLMQNEMMKKMGGDLPAGAQRPNLQAPAKRNSQ